MAVKIVLVDDHQVMREGLRAILSNKNEIDVVGEAEDGRAALDLIRQLEPQVVIMDVGMPNMNGIEATRRIRDQFSGVQVVALSTHSDKRYVLNMIEAGAAGYVLKDAASDDLVRAVQAVSEGQNYLSPNITDVVFDRCREKPDHRPESSAYNVLGTREREVLQLLAEGLTSKEIAGRLHLSTKTVETHRRNITRKLDLHSVASLTKYAVREGLTSLED